MCVVRDCAPSLSYSLTNDMPCISINEKRFCWTEFDWARKKWLPYSAETAETANPR